MADADDRAVATTHALAVALHRRRISLASTHARNALNAERPSNAAAPSARASCLCSTACRASTTSARRRSVGAFDREDARIFGFGERVDARHVAVDLAEAAARPGQNCLQDLRHGLPPPPQGSATPHAIRRV
jgi:hypothetical protein